MHFENRIGQVYRPAGENVGGVVLRLADERRVFQDVFFLRVNFLNDEEGNKFYRAFVAWCKGIEFNKEYSEKIRNSSPVERFEEFFNGYKVSV